MNIRPESTWDEQLDALRRFLSGMGDASTIESGSGSSSGASTDGLEPLRNALQAYEAVFGQSSGSRGLARAIAGQGMAILSRVNQTHVTASVMLSDHAGRLLLTLHAKYHTWQQLGGHLSGEVDPRTAARREAVEESGLKHLLLLPVPVDIDIHPVECDPGATGTHVDICYVGMATGDLRPVRSQESADLRWVNLRQAERLCASRRVLHLGRSSILVAEMVAKSGKSLLMDGT